MIAIGALLGAFGDVSAEGAEEGPRHAAPHGAQRPRYIFFNLTPGIEYDQNRPDSFTRTAMDEVTRTINAPDNPLLRIGVSAEFSILETKPEVLAESLRAFLRASEASRTPVLVVLDGQNWWETRSDLWNWWDPKLPGHDPRNVENVEWTGWEPASAVKIGWRNWGRQIRVRPAPNIAGPKFMNEHVAAYRVLVPILVQWFRSLPEDRKYLCGGLKVGWEAGIGYNAFYYPNGNRYVEERPSDDSHDPQTGLDVSKGLSGGCAQLGYAAVKTAGIKSSGVLTRDDLGKVTQMYLARLARAAHDLGMPKALIFTHQGGTMDPWEVHLPFWPAINEWSTPGWSFYGIDPNRVENLRADLERAGGARWAAAEWWWGAPDKKTWEEHFERTLRFADCRFICVYNWNCGFCFVKEKAGQEAVRDLVTRWKE